MFRRHPLLVALALTFLAAGLISCGSTNPNSGRILVSIAVTPVTADAQNFPDGQVVFTATGTFSLPPLTAPATFTPPYSGSFTVDNTAIATIVGTGTGTVTVQCVSGASSTVLVIASASANNGTSTIISGTGQLTCP